jgi:hypothetical protein
MDAQAAWSQLPVGPRVLLLSGTGLVAVLLLMLCAPAGSLLPNVASQGEVATAMDAVPDSALAAPAVVPESTLGRPVTLEERRTEQFRYDLRAFAADLVTTRLVAPDRAKYLSYWAVTEAYRQQVPPALVFAVMSVENTTFTSRAMSNVGARGLMQVMPLWLRYLGPKYGFDLGDDRTNLAMGVHILHTNLGEAHGDWRQGLLRYNGCVHGTNTPNCQRYADHVRMAMERQARWLCPTRNFDVCVSAPVALGFGRRP